MKRLLQTAAVLGLVAAGSIIGAALQPLVINAGQIPLINTATTAVEPGNLAGHLNALTQRINQNLGELTFLGAPFVSATGTGEQTVASYTLPPTLQNGATSGPGSWVGAVLHQKCWGTRANDGDVVTAKLYFGAQSASLVVTASAATNWQFDSWTQIYGNALNQTLFVGNNTAVANAITNAAGTDSISGGAVVMKCTITDGTSSAGDATVDGYFADIIH